MGFNDFQQTSDSRIPRQTSAPYMFLLIYYSLPARLCIEVEGVLCLPVCVCLCVCLSVCPQDNSRTREKMSTKLGKHGQGFTLQKCLNFCVDSISDVDPGSLFPFA